MNRRTFLAKLAVVAAALPVVGKCFKPKRVEIFDTKPSGEHFDIYKMDDLCAEQGRFVPISYMAFFRAAEDIKKGQAVCFEMGGLYPGKEVRQVRSDETAWLAAGTAMTSASKGTILTVRLPT